MSLNTAFATAGATGGKPKLAGQRLVLDSRDLPFRCTLETQNFRPPDEKELTFSAYGYQGTEVCGVRLATKRVTNYSNAPAQYDEPEGIFPDGKFTCVECDRDNGAKHKGSQYIDIWKLALRGSGQMERLTYFNRYPGYKASNPVTSDDGKFLALPSADGTVPLVDVLTGKEVAEVVEELQQEFAPASVRAE